VLYAEVWISIVVLGIGRENCHPSLMGQRDFEQEMKRQNKDLKRENIMSDGGGGSGDKIIAERETRM